MRTQERPDESGVPPWPGRLTVCATNLPLTLHYKVVYACKDEEHVAAFHASAIRVQPIQQSVARPRPSPSRLAYGGGHRLLPHQRAPARKARRLALPFHAMSRCRRADSRRRTAGERAILRAYESDGRRAGGSRGGFDRAPVAVDRSAGGPAKGRLA